MPIISRQQAVTTEEKLDKILEIISKMHNTLDADFMRTFILEICQRYCDKINEVNKLNLSSSLIGMNNFEKEYMERIINEFKID